ncbi:hypothetical protein G6F70_007919 [Rhizopus microsporus]|nr:hypothetical protein G6F71_007903 [Rhizopus microsporus]KAG1195851.1 hypothetical protein G6F70_007919 [Rhizopus microsporus]KAG1233150.1 hypothetical protein G6F67_004491 [Rhizopus microsporus]
MASIQKVTSETEYISMDISREFHSEDKSTYWLPKDEEEQKRLIANLDFEKGVTILDVGCGSGVWMMDMMHEYPNCTFYGCDIVNTVNRVLDLEKINFSYGNVVKGLPYPDNTFDFVHMRFFVLALRIDEWPLAVKEVIRVTKPGGFIQLSDVDGKLPKETSVAYYKLMSAIQTACNSRGQNAEMGKELDNLVRENDNVKIVQADYRAYENTAAAKKFVWDIVEGAKSMQPALGPLLGLKNKVDMDHFSKELKHCLETKESFFYLNSVAAQKIQ